MESHVLLQRIALLFAVAFAVACSRVEDAGSYGQDRWNELRAAHTPFSVKHPHPEYGFFFKPVLFGRPDAAGICSISPDGFRGATPADRKSRKLAFLVGDSVIFGFASSDTTTISGYLNQMQDDFLFVNAGVPSWNTTQMHARLRQDLLRYAPDLVVVWGGYNDASIAYRYAVSGSKKPVGTPEALTSTSRPSRTSLWTRARSALGRRSKRDGKSPVGIDLDSLAIEVADHLVDNMRRMETASRNEGADFLAILQPSLQFHRNAHNSGERPALREPYTATFRERVIEQMRPETSFLDLSSVFDEYFDRVPVFTPGRGPDLTEQVFVDDVHLFEPGNRIVAETIWRQLQGRQ